MKCRTALRHATHRRAGRSHPSIVGPVAAVSLVAWLMLSAVSAGQSSHTTPLPPPSDELSQVPVAAGVQQLESKIPASPVPHSAELSLVDLPAQAKSRLWGPNQPRELKWVVSGLLAMSGMWLALQLLRSGRRPPGELSADVLEWLGSIPVDQRHRLLLVRLGSQVLLLSQSEGQLQTLAAVSDPGEVQALLVTCRHGEGGSSPAWAARGATLSREVRRRINELS